MRQELADALIPGIREAAKYSHDAQTQRTLGLIVSSVKRLEKRPLTDESTAQFRSALIREIRLTRATLSLLGSDSLVDVRQSLVDNLRTLDGASSLEKSVERFMLMVADREVRLGSEPAIGETVKTAMSALTSGRLPPPGDQIAKLLYEAVCAVESFGAVDVSLAAIREDLRSASR